MYNHNSDETVVCWRSPRRVVRIGRLFRTHYRLEVIILLLFFFFCPSYLGVSRYLMTGVCVTRARVHERDIINIILFERAYDLSAPERRFSRFTVVALFRPRRFLRIWFDYHRGILFLLCHYMRL